MISENNYDLKKVIRDALRANIDRASEYTNRALLSETSETSERYFALAQGMLEANRNVIEALTKAGAWQT